jgi:hypothetical protein
MNRPGLMISRLFVKGRTRKERSADWLPTWIPASDSGRSIRQAQVGKHFRRPVPFHATRPAKLAHSARYRRIRMAWHLPVRNSLKDRFRFFHPSGRIGGRWGVARLRRSRSIGPHHLPEISLSQPEFSPNPFLSSLALKSFPLGRNIS